MFGASPLHGGSQSMNSNGSNGRCSRRASSFSPIARRELYRRLRRIGETTVDVAERVVYSVVKQS